MRFDLAKIDFKGNVVDQLKAQYHEIVNYMIASGERDNNKSSMMTLYHGTSVYNIFDILQNGLLTRLDSGVSNYDDSMASNQALTYLTNKWHYYYAYNAYGTLFEKGILQQNNNIPAYIAVEVDAENLVMEEDFFHSKYLMKKVHNQAKKGIRYLDVYYEECLSQHATVAHFGNIDKYSIKEILIFTDSKAYFETYIDEDTQYMKELHAWFNCQGKGSMKLKDLKAMEESKEYVRIKIDNPSMLSKAIERLNLIKNKPSVGSELGGMA